MVFLFLLVVEPTFQIVPAVSKNLWVTQLIGVEECSKHQRIYLGLKCNILLIGQITTYLLIVIIFLVFYY